MKFKITMTVDDIILVMNREYKSWGRAEYYTARKANEINASHWQIYLDREEKAK